MMQPLLTLLFKPDSVQSSATGITQTFEPKRKFEKTNKRPKDAWKTEFTKYLKSNKTNQHYAKNGLSLYTPPRI